MYTEGRAEMDDFYADYSQFFDYGVQGPSYSAGVAKTNSGDLTGAGPTLPPIRPPYPHRVNYSCHGQEVNQMQLLGVSVNMAPGSVTPLPTSAVIRVRLLATVALYAI